MIVTVAAVSLGSRLEGLEVTNSNEEFCSVGSI